MITVSSKYVYSYKGAIADDGTTTLSTLVNAAMGWIGIGTTPEWTKFIIDSSGNVVLIRNTDNVTSNADTDGYLCIGTAAAQNPLIIKNRLGSTKTINVFILCN